MVVFSNLSSGSQGACNLVGAPVQMEADRSIHIKARYSFSVDLERLSCASAFSIIVLFCGTQRPES